jgi:hypothetical protein
MRIWVAAVLVSLSLTAVEAQSTQSDRFALSAVRIDRDGDTVHMRGNVVVRFDGNVITADQADVNTATGEMNLSGNVQLRVGSREQLTPEQQAVLGVDEEFRLAQINHDVAVLDRILHPAYYGMNQNGNGRNKTQLIDLWRTFRIDSLTTDAFEVRVTGDTAIVTGRQTERNPTGTDRMVFTRTYVRNDGRWQLLNTMQFRNPRDRALTQ